VERTHRPVAFQGLAWFEYDYDDAKGQVVRVRGSNDGPGTLRVRMLGSAESEGAASFVYERTFPAHSGLTEVNVPQAQKRKRFALEPDGRGPAAADEPDYYPTLRGLGIEASY
jgi:hypothetical protein